MAERAESLGQERKRCRGGGRVGEMGTHPHGSILTFHKTRKGKKALLEQEAQSSLLAVNSSKTSKDLRIKGPAKQSGAVLCFLPHMIRMELTDISVL